MTLKATRQLFVATMLVQGFHVLEHVLQVTQVSLGIAPAHGLIGALNLEWVHFFYNGAYLVLLIILCIDLGFLRLLPSYLPHRLTFFTIISLTTLWQGYHMVEHVVKLKQHLATGLQGTPGILGAHINLVWLHFFLNVAVYLPFLYVLYRLRTYLFHEKTTPLCNANPCPWVASHHHS